MLKRQTFLVLLLLSWLKSLFSLAQAKETVPHISQKQLGTRINMGNSYFFSISDVEGSVTFTINDRQVTVCSYRSNGPQTTHFLVHSTALSHFWFNRPATMSFHEFNEFRKLARLLITEMVVAQPGADSRRILAVLRQPSS